MTGTNFTRRKPWHTKEWKERRDKIINDSSVCELCGSTENLVIHHPNSKTREMLWDDVWRGFYIAFCDEYEKIYPTEEEKNEFSVLNKGKKGEKMHRHEGCINWHYVSTKHKKCKWYNYSNNVQIRRDFSKEFEEFNNTRWHKMWDEAKEANMDMIISTTDELVEIENKKYMEFEDIQVLCKRCHFAHHKGMNLCPVCKKYKKKQYRTCWECKNIAEVNGDDCAIQDDMVS